MSIGAELANARRQAGLTIAQVSQRTRIRAAIVEGIERDDYSVCGGDFYARGHIRAIARVAGIDSEPLVREYDDARVAATQEDIPVARPARSGRPAAAAGTAPATARTTVGAARAGAGSTGIAGPGTVPGGPGAGADGQRPPGAPRRGPWTVVLLVLAGALAGVIIDHAVSSHGAAGPAALGKPAAASRPSASPRASAPPTPTPTPPSPSPSPTPNPSNVTISLAAGSEPCWAQLTTANGTTVYQGILANGSTMSWTEGQAVTLTLGNPGAVTLTVNGKVQSGLGLNPVTLNLAPGQSSAG